LTIWRTRDDLADGGFVGGRDRGEPRLDGMDAGLAQGLGQADFVVGGQFDPGLLLTVAQRHVVNL
jgi:hypothetical protein